MLEFDYHTHTVYSHGTATVAENAQAALAAGIPCLGIAEHGGGHVCYGVRGKKLEQLQADVVSVQKATGLRILFGIEANLMGDGKTDLPRNAAERFDFMILGYHRGVVPKDSLCFRWMLSQPFPGLGKDAVRNALGMCHAIERTPGLYCIAHPGEYIPVDIASLARCAAEHQVALEINARHLTMSVEQLQIAAEQGAFFTVGSDAHSAGRVGDVAKAVAHARKAGVLDRVLNWKD